MQCLLEMSMGVVHTTVFSKRFRYMTIVNLFESNLSKTFFLGFVVGFDGVEDLRNQSEEGGVLYRHGSFGIAPGELQMNWRYVHETENQTDVDHEDDRCTDCKVNVFHFVRSSMNSISALIRSSSLS
ncbi:hypothetical protein RsoM2USA_286 [Ralstonia phage RsoM2USA]|nr:hypothetical protein RsoM2USA_286 [Ralstonia phage RsoM2USA]